MGQLPGIPETQFARGEPPGQAGQVPMSAPPNIEGRSITEAIIAGGKLLESLAAKTFKEEMVAEYSEKESRIRELGWAANESVVGDEGADRALEERLRSDVDAIIGSAKYKDVGDQLKSFANTTLPTWTHSIREISLKRRGDNADDQAQITGLRLLETGDIDGYISIHKNRFALGRITKEKLDQLIKTAPEQSQLAIAARLIADGKYDLGIAVLDKMEGIDLTTPQLQQTKVLRAATEQLKNDRAEIFDKETRKAILSFKPGDDPAKLHDLRQQILANPDISGLQMQTLTNLYDSRISGMGKAYTNEQKLAAYAEVSLEKDPEKKLALLMKNAGAFTPEKAQSIYDSITDPKSLMKVPFYKEWDAAIDELYGASSTTIVPKEKRVEWAQTKDQLDQIAATTGNDYAKAQTQIETLVTPVKKEKAKGWLSRTIPVNHPIIYALKPWTMVSDLWSGNYMKKSPAQTDGRIKVVSPSGQTGTIPESQWSEAEKEGYKKVE